MSEINLLKTTTTTETNASSKITQIIIRVMIGLLIIVIGFYVFLLIAQWSVNKKITQANQALQQVQNDVINNKSRAEVIARQGQVKAANDIIANHSYWSRLLPELARVSLSSASYSSIEADEAGKLSLVVKVSSYSDLDKFMQIFDLPEYNKYFSKVRLSSVSKVQEEASIILSAVLELTFDQSFLKIVNK